MPPRTPKRNGGCGQSRNQRNRRSSNTRISQPRRSEPYEDDYRSPSPRFPQSDHYSTSRSNRPLPLRSRHTESTDDEDDEEDDDDDDSWEDGIAPRGYRPASRDTQSTSRDTNIPRIVIPEEFRLRPSSDESEDEAYESDIRPGRRSLYDDEDDDDPPRRSKTSSDGSLPRRRVDSSEDEGYVSESRRKRKPRRSKHRRSVSLSDSDLSPTSGASLAHTQGQDTRPTEEANEVWDDNSRISKNTARKRRKRHTKKRFQPSMADMHPTVSTDPTSVIREIDTEAMRLAGKTAPDDNIYVPFSKDKKKLRVAYAPHNWSENYWKTEEVPEGKDKEKAWCAQNLPSFDGYVTKTALGILRESQVSLIPDDLTEDEETWVKTRTKLLQKATAYQQQKKPMTKEMKAIIKEADTLHAPTTVNTMSANYEMMHKHLWEEDKWGRKITMNPTSTDKVNTVMETLTAEDQKELRKEMRLFKKAGLIRQEHLQDEGYMMLQNHGTLSWMAADKYTKNDHAADILSMFLDGKTVICTDDESRRKYLDTGEGIDPPKSQNWREFLLATTHGDDDRDYKTDKYLPSKVVDDATALDQRELVLSGYDDICDQIEDMLINPGGKVSRAEYSRGFVLGQKRSKKWKVFESELEAAKKYEDPRYQNAYSAQAIKSLAKANKKIDRLSFYDAEEWAELYPTTSKYKTYNDAVKAGGESLGRTWWHEYNMAPNMGDTLVHYKHL